MLQIEPALVPALVLTAVLSQLDMLGSVIILDKMEDADWKRANMQAAHSGIKANGDGRYGGGAAGGVLELRALGQYCAGPCHPLTARAIGLATALLLALVAFLPQATLALTLIPAGAGRGRAVRGRVFDCLGH